MSPPYVQITRLKSLFDADMLCLVLSLHSNRTINAYFNPHETPAQRSHKQQKQFTRPEAT